MTIKDSEMFTINRQPASAAKCNAVRSSGESLADMRSAFRFGILARSLSESIRIAVMMASWIGMHPSILSEEKEVPA